MKIFLSIVGILFIGAILALLFAFPFMWIWNWLMPAKFGLPELGYWECWGLQFITGCLFRPPSQLQS